MWLACQLACATCMPNASSMQERNVSTDSKEDDAMGLIEVASGNSVWRGMDYYNDKKVKSWKNAGDGIYEGIVSGSGDNIYVVHIDKNHPRKSICNCPFANGRRVVCKHMIALYFTAEPKAAVDFTNEVEPVGSRKGIA